MAGEKCNKEEETLRKLLLRRWYKCAWSYTDDIVEFDCDGEKFYIDPNNLDKKNKAIFYKMLKNETRKTD